MKNILDTTLGCARGLRFLHQNKMIHGDIKPSNLYGKGINIKLDGLWLPKNGGFTPAYASLEPFEDLAIDESTDIWSLGVTLVELLLGDRQWSKGPVCSLVYEEHLRINQLFRKGTTFTGNDMRDNLIANEIEDINNGRSYADLKSGLNIYGQRIDTLKWSLENLKRIVTALNL